MGVYYKEVQLYTITPYYNTPPSKRRSLKVLWNLALCLLFIFCIIELIVAGEHFCKQVELSLNEFLENIVVSGGGSDKEIEEPIFFNEFASYSTSESKNLNLAIQLYGEDQTRSNDDDNQPIGSESV
ncbi:unnamed protein product [Meloidogyne enterolobii]|uniref:Uncharacterized protein n=1 Tax=Meloidogyne enterolobii TaxID=390850 RepID=A0ACB0YZE8_MELEN